MTNRTKFAIGINCFCSICQLASFVIKLIEVQDMDFITKMDWFYLVLSGSLVLTFGLGAYLAYKDSKNVK